MFSAIAAFFTALPEVISLVKDILKKIGELIDLQKENELRKKIILASDQAIASKDSSELEKIFRGEK